jgi:hypothetical protein
VSRRDQCHDGQSSIEVQANWHPGARTPAWAALWRQIFADLGDIFDQTVSDDEVNAAGDHLPMAEPDQDEV